MSSSTSGRSTRAVVTGAVVTGVLTFIGYYFAKGTALIPNDHSVPVENNLLLFNSVIALFSMVGGYVTARLAPRNAKDHTISLGVVLTVVGLIASIFLSLAHYGPNWFGWLLVLTGLPFAWLGGKFKRERDRDTKGT